MKRALLAMVLAAASALACAQDGFTVDLHHRSAEALIAVLRPLIAPATLSGAGMQLQVHAPAAEQARLLDLIRQVDRPLRALAIALREQAPPVEEKDVQSAPANDGSITLSTGRDLPADRYGNAQVLSTRPPSQASSVIEGERLLISMPAAQSLRFRVPAAGAKAAGSGAQASSGATAGSASATAGASGPEVGGVVHFEAASDFTVRIWLAGQTVAIELQPRLAGRVGAGAYDSDASAMVYGRLGEWIALADSGRPLQPGTASAPRTGLWIRVQAPEQ